MLDIKISKSADVTSVSCVGVRVSNTRAAKNYRDERCDVLVHKHRVKVNSPVTCLNWPKGWIEV
jgi:tRNA A-37 threonylcarbamoyl transferase component Bud32